MLPKHLFLAFLWCVLACYCTQHPQNDKKTPKTTASKKAQNYLEGDWILTDLTDSTLKYKEIARFLYENKRISLVPVTLVVQGDTLSCYGIWYSPFPLSYKLHLKNRDTLAQTSGKMHPDSQYTVVYAFNTQKEAIELKINGKIHSYKRFGKQEKEFYDTLPKRIQGGARYFTQTVYYFDALFAKEVLAGKYKAIDKIQDVQSFEIYPTSPPRSSHFIVKGFKCFTNIEFDDYLWTQNSFLGKDGVSFWGRAKDCDNAKYPLKPIDWKKMNINKKDYEGKDTLNLSSMHQPEGYEFKFRGDTLYLYEMLRDRAFMHFEGRGTKTYRFIKQ